jgi:hypothetical protein
VFGSICQCDTLDAASILYVQYETLSRISTRSVRLDAYGETDLLKALMMAFINGAVNYRGNQRSSSFEMACSKRTCNKVPQGQLEFGQVG